MGDDLGVRLAVVEAVLEERRRALELQAVENLRRLDALNHAHTQLVSMQETFLRRDLHDAFLQRFERSELERLAFQDDTRAKLAGLSGRDTGLRIAWLVAGGLVAMLAGLLGIFAYLAG